MAEAKKSTAPKAPEHVTKAELYKAKSELRAEIREGLAKIARAVNIDYDSIT